MYYFKECPRGAVDFREEQCAQFDNVDFQGKRYSWVPYYGATNPCELNCVPRGENFFYRHRPAVVDGTLCYVGRSDICVDGVCRLPSQGEFMGLDDVRHPEVAPAPVAVAPHPTERVTYAYTSGVYGQCSATCNGGMRYRSVQCIAQDTGASRVVDESYCISQRLQRPASQQACNMQPCVVEYSVSSFSVCSVTCGEGQQTREVFCVGSGGERLADHACSGLARPPAVQACRRPACHTQITWHASDYGLCTRSCGGGVRERRVGCFDTNLNPYTEDRCGPTSRPAAVEACNTQPCPGAQMVPSVQDPRGHESTMRGFMPHVPGQPSAPGPHTNVPYDPYQSVIGPYCAQSYYGCCPDGFTSATGPRNAGCTENDCVRTRYGCCLDGVTPAQGFGRSGCPEQQTTLYPASSAPPPAGDVCSLPRDAGPCDTWLVRFYYDSGSGKCTEFWYGSCQGNANNFVSMEACKTKCGGSARATTRTAPSRVTPRRGSPGRAVRVRA
ncbi:papilin b, proteoglycan-like sulfated glycoprotein isoform X2 [Lampris incognitus]|uniref:papilin b, proteoglycan-like sulfated glycoprotein isoform X2 n=1 Tax=Lampris incognitus TaxID=2546036 RepID=UPI0024B5E56A|nr:papilin b, proteoglycan-like sulfated glycoprotein isoform X2 [Lampris incognitus]